MPAPSPPCCLGLAFASQTPPILLDIESELLPIFTEGVGAVSTPAALGRLPRLAARVAANAQIRGERGGRAVRVVAGVRVRVGPRGGWRGEIVAAGAGCGGGGAEGVPG